jgi:hypothetical protein
MRTSDNTIGSHPVRLGKGKKAKKLLKLEGKIELKLTTKELLARRKKDIFRR